MIYLYLFGTCFHFIYVFMIIGNMEIINFFIVIEMVKMNILYFQYFGKNLPR